MDTKSVQIRLKRGGRWAQRAYREGGGWNETCKTSGANLYVTPAQSAASRSVLRTGLRYGWYSPAN